MPAADQIADASMPYKMFMQEVMHVHSLADPAQFSGGCDPKDKGEIVEKGFQKASWIHIAEANQTL